MADYFRCKAGFAFPYRDGMRVLAADTIVDETDPGYKHDPSAFEPVSKVAADAVTRKAGKRAERVEATTAAPGERRAAAVPKK